MLHCSPSGLGRLSSDGSVRCSNAGHPVRRSDAFFYEAYALGSLRFFDPQERFLSQTSAAEVPASQLENILKQLGQTVEGLGDFIDLNADVHPVAEGVDQVGEQITAQSLLVSGAVREGAGRFLAMQAKPDDSSEWRISGAAGALDVVNVVTEQGLLAESGASQFRFIPATGCTEFPEISVNARGEPFKGRNPDGTVFGYAETHMHLGGHEMFGGRLGYGKPFHKFGVAHALGRCEENHGPTGGAGSGGRGG